MAITKADSDDPRGKVISQFKVFWNDPSPRRVVVLQFPNRDQKKPYNARSYLQPTQMRWKSQSQFIEVDVPLDTQLPSYFNEEQAQRFGETLAKNSLIQNGGSFGLAGGFGIGGITGRSSDRQKGDAIATSEQAPGSAEAKDNVLRQLTLSGKVQQFKEGDFIYAMATFKGDEIHLTRVHSICSLSPHNKHLDALADNERASHIRSTEAGVAGPDARVVNVSMKSANVESTAPEDIGRTLRELQEDEWKYLQWVDEDDNQSYCAFQDYLFYKETGPVEQLVSTMTASTYLDAISAPKRDDRAVGETIMRRSGARLADIWDESTDEESSTVEVMQEEGQRRQRAID